MHESVLYSLGNCAYYNNEFVVLYEVVVYCIYWVNLRAIEA